MIGTVILVTGIFSGIAKVDTIGFRMESFVTTFVGETKEFIMILVNGVNGSDTTVLQTSANACNCVVFTSGTVICAVDVDVDVVVVRLMHVFTLGIIGIIGITTENKII